MSKLSTTRHEIAKLRPELRMPTVPRVAPAGPTSAPIKAPDPETDRMVAAFYAAQEGRRLCAEGQGYVDEQMARGRGGR